MAPYMCPATTACVSTRDLTWALCVSAQGQRGHVLERHWSLEPSNNDCAGEGQQLFTKPYT
jgi:hypothetical protein